MRTGEGAAHAPSTRGRKRKNHSHAPPWDPASAARANMPRASGVRGAQAARRPYYNAVFGLERDEDITDALVDTLDLATPRDFAVARYAQNHDLLASVFGPQRLDMMRPPPSPYEGKDIAALRSELMALQAELETMEAAPPPSLATLPKDDEEGAVAAVAEEPWAQEPSSGAIVAMGYVPMSPPEDIAAQLAPHPPARQEASAMDQDMINKTRAAIAQVSETHRGPEARGGSESARETVPGGDATAAGASRGEAAEEAAAEEETNA
ncbi:hypothetical protein MSPP1_000055 [Malassezia sp. CBS 17886]|nr:hypothetical protein MSPP1_000055 [Malassezia sp. CBS 17886]